MGVHARVGPSSITRVLICAPSVRAGEGLPRTSNIYSAEGTLLHEISADCLELGMDPANYIGKTLGADGFEFTVTEDMAECMVPGLDWILQQPGELFVEKRVSLEPWMPGQFGTLDVGLYDSASQIATIFDWKFGEGVVVSAIWNDQLRAYALGFYYTILMPLGIRPIEFHIIIEQPRCRGGSNFGQPWVVSFDDLMAYGENVLKPMMAAIDDPNAPFVASAKGCQFCEVKNRPGGCDPHSEWLLDFFGQKFEDLDSADELVMPNKGSLSAERRSVIVQNKNVIIKFLSDLHAATLDDAIAGRPTPGLKAVQGDKGDRKWKDPEAVEAVLVETISDAAFTKKLISPAQVEKLIAPKRGRPGHPEVWAGLQALVGQDDGRPILVGMDHERPALKSVDQKFDDEAQSEGDEDGW